MPQTAVFDARELTQALTLAQRVVGKRSTIPVLETVKLEVSAKQDIGKITANDLDVQIEIDLRVAASADFACLLLPNTLLRFLKGEAGVIEITNDTKAKVVTLGASGCTLQLRHLIDVIDFPLWAKSNAILLDAATVSQDHLHTALAHVRPCISAEAARYYLNGAYFHAHEDNLRIVSTDGHRLAKYECDVAWPFEPAIIPTKAVDLMRSLVSKGGNGSVAMSVSDQRLWFQVNGITIRSKAIDGTYPDYKRVIALPADKITTALSAAQLSKMPDRKHEIVIHPDAGEISSYDPISNATTTVPTTGKGPKCGFQVGYLKDFLKVSPVISITGQSPRDPFQLHPEDPRCDWVLMPMRV